MNARTVFADATIEPADDWIVVCADRSIALTVAPRSNPLRVQNQSEHKVHLGKQFVKPYSTVRFVSGRPHPDSINQRLSRRA
jgi:hypothetical protein